LEEIVGASEEDVKPANLERLDELQVLRLESTRLELSELMVQIDPVRYPLAAADRRSVEVDCA
jgi:hypothetical protein